MAVVRVAMFIFEYLRVVLFWLGNGMVEWAEVCLVIACTSLMPCAADGGDSNAVDIFHATSGTWSTAALSSARRYPAATSLPNHGVAIFAGGDSTCCQNFAMLIFVSWRVVLCGLGNGMVDWAEVVFADCVYKSHALRSGQRRLLQRCGHLQRDVWNLENCKSQLSSI